MSTQRSKLETLEVIKLANNISDNLEIHLPTQGPVRYAIHGKHNANFAKFFDPKIKKIIKKSFAENYFVTIWGNNHITLEPGKGFHSIL